METQPQLYLIAHKVRGEPAFDIAHQLQIGEEVGWIVPTSGHRAYPYYEWPLNELWADRKYIPILPDCPPDWPDHYETHADKGQGKIKDLFSALGFARPTPTINRRL